MQYKIQKNTKQGSWIYFYNSEESLELSVRLFYMVLHVYKLNDTDTVNY